MTAYVQADFFSDFSDSALDILFSFVRFAFWEIQIFHDVFSRVDVNVKEDLVEILIQNDRSKTWNLLNVFFEASPKLVELLQLSSFPEIWPVLKDCSRKLLLKHVVGTRRDAKIVVSIEPASVSDVYHQTWKLLLLFR